MSVRLVAKFVIWPWWDVVFYGGVREFTELDSAVLQTEINSMRMKYFSASRLNESQSAFLRLVNV